MRALAASGLLLGARPSSAALQVGPPFPLADAKAMAFEPSIAGNGRGFVLSWSTKQRIHAQKLRTDASLSGPPLTLAAPSTGTAPPMPGIRQSFELGAPVVSASEQKFLVQFARTLWWITSQSVTTPQRGPSQLQLRVLDEDRVYASPFQISATDDVTQNQSGMSSKAGDGFALLLGLVTYGGSVTPRLVLGTSNGPAAVELPRPELVEELPLIGVASNGQTALVAHRHSVADQTPTFLRVTADGTITELTLPGISNRMGHARLAPFASAHLVAWFENGGLLALRVDANGKALDQAPIPVGGSTTSVETLVDVEPGENCWLVLSEATQGGRHLRVRRLSFEGKVLDPDGLDLDAGLAGELAYASGNHWLIATHESLNGKDSIVGRFIGDGALPDPPNNVPQAPEGAVVVPSTGGARSAGGARNAGGAGGVGNTGASGGTSSSAADAGDAPAGNGGGGCTVATPDRGHGLWVGAIALACFARRRAPRLFSRALPRAARR